VVAAVVGMLLTSQATSTTTSNAAPDFTLPTTADTRVTLSSLRGRPVLLYFSEGAGCGACLLQMSEIEKRKADFDALGVTVLPIVMNSRADITSDLNRYGVSTPFLLDDGTVSRAYGTLGRGMHADLPGHSFVLIDAAGVQRWYGEYTSMWLDPAALLEEIRSRLG
jgi:peroxiredoxin